MTHHRGSELRIEEVIAHCVMLRVIPQRGYGVAVVITHVHAGSATRCIAAFRKFIQHAVVIGLLLVGVVVVVIAGGFLAAIQAERRHRVRIARC